MTGVILVEQSTVAYRKAQQAVGKGVALTGIATLAALVLVTLVTTTTLVVRPVRRLVKVVRRMAGGDLTARAPVNGRGELAHLSATVNGMAEDLGRSIEEIRDKTAELSIVYSILGRVTKSISMTALKNVVIDTFNEIMGADRTLLITAGSEGQPVEVLSKARGAQRIDRFIDEDSVGKAVRFGAPASAIGEWLTGREFEPHVSEDRHAAILPIEARPHTSHLLVVLRSQPFTEGEANTKLLRVVAGHVTGAFENSRLYNAATTDELTRFATARHLYTGIEAQTARNEADEARCALLMLEIDGFAALAGQWGTAVGNLVLKNVASQVMRLIRFGDSAFRYRGEVFAILIPGCDLAMATMLANRIRASVESTTISADAGHPVRVSLSVGGVVWASHTITPQDLVTAADVALAEARRVGRVHVVEALPV